MNSKILSRLCTNLMSDATNSGERKMSEDRYMLDLAIAQFTGYAYTVRGGANPLTEITSSMGLTAKEYKEIRKDLGFMPPGDLEELDEYFKNAVVSRVVLPPPKVSEYVKKNEVLRQIQNALELDANRGCQYTCVQWLPDPLNFAALKPQPKSIHISGKRFGERNR